MTTFSNIKTFLANLDPSSHSNFPVKTRASEHTWMDRPGIKWSFQKTKSSTSKRISIIVWDDGSNEVDLKVIKGDGRRLGFETFKSIKTDIDGLVTAIVELNQF